MKIRFIVYYIDNFHKRHTTFATSMAEVQKFKDKFNKVTYDII